jgi:uncharacterized membrane protein
MGATLAILALWLAFAVTHIAMSSLRLRPRLVGTLGERGFLGLYSLVALATFIPLVHIYFANRHAGPELWSSDFGVISLWLIYLGMGLALVLAVSGLVAPSPALLGASGAKLRGVHLITRHAFFMGVALFGILHVIANGFASDLAFFGGFPVFVLVGARHQDQRKLAGGDPEFRAFHDRTAFLPFTGPETASGLRDFSRVAVVVGVLLTVLLRVFHDTLFGG